MVELLPRFKGIATNVNVPVPIIKNQLNFCPASRGLRRTLAIVSIAIIKS